MGYEAGGRPTLTDDTLLRHFACTRVSCSEGAWAPHAWSANLACQSRISAAAGRRPRRSYSARHQSLKGCQKRSGLRSPDAPILGGTAAAPVGVLVSHGACMPLKPSNIIIPPPWLPHRAPWPACSRPVNDAPSR